MLLSHLAACGANHAALRSLAKVRKAFPRTVIAEQAEVNHLHEAAKAEEPWPPVLARNRSRPRPTLVRNRAPQRRRLRRSDRHNQVQNQRRATPTNCPRRQRGENSSKTRRLPPTPAPATKCAARYASCIKAKAKIACSRSIRPPRPTQQRASQR
jgi:hypothetical protein